MTKEFYCRKHGDIGQTVLNVRMIFVAAGVPVEDVPPLKIEHVCARCAAEVIDDAFIPLREKK